MLNRGRGLGSGWLPASTSQWGREGTGRFGGPALWPLWDSFGGKEHLSPLTLPRAQGQGPSLGDKSTWTPRWVASGLSSFGCQVEIMLDLTLQDCCEDEPVQVTRAFVASSCLHPSLTGLLVSPHTLLLPYRLPHCFSHRPRSLPPPGFCTGCSLHLEHPSLRRLMISSLPSFRSLLRYPLFRGTFPGHLI